MHELDLAQLSVVFISYDEPEADENFARLAQAAPHAARVHGVTGFDAAHRRAGDLAQTPHVVTVDADNVIVEPDFFARRIAFAPQELTAVISFSARIAHNGLAYGNGGVKIWPRPLLQGLRTHEAAPDRGAAVDFAWRIPQIRALGMPSETRVTGSPLQAFRAGFREGMRLTMHRGVPLPTAFPELAPAEAVARGIGRRNLDRLRLWCSVGRDVENGDWAILGARTGCVMAVLDRAEMARVADFDWIEAWWRNDIAPTMEDTAARADRIARLGDRLRDELALLVADLSPEASAFARSIHRPPPRLGPLGPV